MFTVGPTFFGGSGTFDEGLLTPGTPTPSAIGVSGTFLLGAGTCGVG